MILNWIFCGRWGATNAIAASQHAVFIDEGGKLTGAAMQIGIDHLTTEAAN